MADPSCRKNKTTVPCKNGDHSNVNTLHKSKHRLRGVAGAVKAGKRKQAKGNIQRSFEASKNSCAGTNRSWWGCSNPTRHTFRRFLLGASSTLPLEMYVATKEGRGDIRRVTGGDMAPFPYVPIAVIVASLVSDQVIQMSVFSYAGFMVEDLGAVDDKDKAGYYAGLLSSSYMIGRLISSRFWGLASDRHGSRFVMAFGLVSSAVLSIAFGLSRNFAWAFVCRFLIGLLNGMNVASRSLVAEVCGPEHETVGMGYTTSSWSLGAVFGPGVGGMLVKPAKHYPRVFSQLGVFGRNPYLLVNLLGAGLALLCLPLMLIYLDAKHAESSSQSGGSGYKYQSSLTSVSSEAEGRYIDVQKPLWIKPSGVPLTASTNGSDNEATRLRRAPKHVKPKSLLAQEHIRVLTVITAVHAVSFSGFDSVINLWALSSAASGGLEWSSLHIGQVFFSCGVMVLIFEIFAVPRLTPWLGIKTSQRLGSVFEIPVYLVIPLLSVLDVGGRFETVALLILLFMECVCANMVGAAAMGVQHGDGHDYRMRLAPVIGVLQIVIAFAVP